MTWPTCWTRAHPSVRPRDLRRRVRRRPRPATRRPMLRGSAMTRRGRVVKGRVDQIWFSSTFASLEPRASTALCCSSAALAHPAGSSATSIRVFSTAAARPSTSTQVRCWTSTPRAPLGRRLTTTTVRGESPPKAAAAPAGSARRTSVAPSRAARRCLPGSRKVGSRSGSPLSRDPRVWWSTLPTRARRVVRTRRRAPVPGTPTRSRSTADP